MIVHKREFVLKRHKPGKSWKQCHCQFHWLSGKSDTDISECAYLFYLFPLMIDDRLPFERALFSSKFTMCFIRWIDYFRRVHCFIAFISGQGEPFRLMCIKCEANKLNWMETIAKDATNDLNGYIRNYHINGTLVRLSRWYQLCDWLSLRNECAHFVSHQSFRNWRRKLLWFSIYV